jgi:hypothetical protein
VSSSFQRKLKRYAFILEEEQPAVKPEACEAGAVAKSAREGLLKQPTLAPSGSKLPSGLSQIGAPLPCHQTLHDIVENDEQVSFIG